MSGPAIAAIGTLFGGGAAAGGGILGLAGGIIGGFGKGLLERGRLKDERKQRAEEDARREARYAGVGDASRLNEVEAEDGNLDPTVATGVTQQRANPHKQSSTPLGFREVTKRIGGGSDSNPSTPKSSRYSYDTGQRRIVQA